MIKVIFRLLLTFSSTSWLLVIFWIKEDYRILGVPRIVMALMLLMIPVLLTGLSILLSRWLDRDCIQECAEIRLADSEFLPVALGYFWVALSVNECFVLLIVYIIIFVFSLLTQALYFNPLFLLFRYHFYHVKTEHGTMLFVALRGKVVRNVEEIDVKDLRRINDVTYMTLRGK